VTAAPGPLYQHVCFDLDGTLVDSRADLADAMNHTLASLGRHRLPSDLLQSFVGEGARRLVERAVGCDASAALVDEALQRFLTRYGAHLLDATRPYEGIAETLEELAARGVLLSVLSNKPEAMSRAILAGLGLAGRFFAVLGGDSLPTRKPDPAGALHLLARGGTPPDRMLLVGDSGVDVRTARAAGLPFCGVAWGLTPDGMWAERPTRVVFRPRALLDVVGDARGARARPGGA
jgi:phosphoglycolate phosphatase